MKKYKTWEVIKMMTENEDLEFKNDSHVIGASILGYLKVKKSKCETLTLDGNVKLNSVWELVKQPVTFNEALESGKNCRVEHELVKHMERHGCVCEESMIRDFFNEVTSGGYLGVNEVIIVLGWMLDSNNFKKIIKEGKWYLED
ncbi:hypothetical protein [Clostridium sp.]|uniref:hypothetical protein n=1 Tax=Clostridium sp. TaxID=1506 RepID=UPI0032173F38